MQEREERVNETAEALGNRIDPNAERQAGGDSYEPDDGRPRDAFAPAPDDASGSTSRRT